MRILIYIILVLFLFSNVGCATIACSLVCDGDEICYSTCRDINESFEEGY